MVDTSASLLERLRDRPDDEAWQRLVELYTPWMQNWLRRAGLRGPDRPGAAPV